MFWRLPDLVLETSQARAATVDHDCVRAQSLSPHAGPCVASTLLGLTLGVSLIASGLAMAAANEGSTETPVNRTREALASFEDLKPPAMPQVQPYR